ncbi:MAG: hypothetical protein V1800_06885 [Candidatus Latescibacterota bacterium]
MAESINIGTRWEPLVDRLLIDRLEGATHRLHAPVRQEVALAMDGPCECSTSYYYNLFQDADRVRLYYRGTNVTQPDGAVWQTANLAESTDGITFTRPKVGTVPVNGSNDNNVVWIDRGAHNFSVFRDENPACDPEQRYKAVGSGADSDQIQQLYAFSSPDGIHWRMIQEEALDIPGGFDSLNVPFWDTLQGCYRLFSRYGDSVRHVRAVQSNRSDDFLHWTDPLQNQYANGVPWEQFYTNATIPCPGAEHVLLSFPMRFMPDRTRSTEGMDYPGEGISDAVFMSSRDGIHWDRPFLEAWLRPGLDPCNWTHRNIMPATGIVATSPTEWSMYVGENYGWNTNLLRRVTVRPMGFASVNGHPAGGELLTPMLTFSGKRLHLNYSTSASGSLTVAICDPDGHPLEGFSDMEPLFGDELDAPLSYDLSSLRGKSVRLRVRLADADLFALRTGD